jgi:DNA-binding IclR family transcriptional regulator
MSGSKIVRSADRALEVLEHLARSDDARSLAELDKELDIPKSTLHGLLWTLVSRGWVEVDESSGRFRIGLQALLVGRGYLETDTVVAMASAALDELAAATGETIHIGRLDGTSIVYLDKRESIHPLRLFSAIGRRLPAFTTALGKSILAQLPEEEALRHLPEPLPRQTDHTITDVGRLMEDLRKARDRGFAIDNQESTEGIRGFAIPILGVEPPHDAISCAVPLSRLDADREAEIVASLRAAVQRIEQRAASELRSGRVRSG